MTLLDVLQQINKSSMDAAGLTDMTVGTVTAADPLEITLDISQAPLKEEIIILTDTVKGKVIDIAGSSYFTDRNGELCCIWGSSEDIPEGSAVVTLPLAVGDKVLLLAVQHGQRYIVLSRL